MTSQAELIQNVAAPIEPPGPTAKAGLLALQTLVRQRNILDTLAALHQELGNVFRLQLPGFSPVVLVGPEANRFVLITARHQLRWRAEPDPVTNLLEHGVLVADGAEHETLRRLMNPALHRRMLAHQVEVMSRRTDQVIAVWQDGEHYDMLDEMRRIALLILIDALFKVDFSPEMGRLWPAILRALAYISPGLWLVWPGMPRPGYARARRELDDYLYQIIDARRNAPGQADDLLGLLVATPGLSDEIIRDQLLTMLIAGHDTSTALLAWTLYLLGRHPAVLAQAQAEVEAVLGCQPPTLAHVSQLRYLEQVINETLRLYPPIHTGLRLAAEDLEFQGYRIPAGQPSPGCCFIKKACPSNLPNA
jgi:cytochrome P450